MEKLIKRYCSKRKTYLIQDSPAKYIEDEQIGSFKVTVNSTIETDPSMPAKNLIEDPKLKEIQILFKNIENESFQDLIIIQKIEFLLRDDVKSFERLNSAKYSNEGYSLLHMAAKTNRTKLCTYLVDRIFTNVNITDKRKMTPLHVLIDFFRTDIFSDLIKFTETFHVFIDKNVNVNQQNLENQTLLHLAIAKPNYTAVSILTNNQNINFNIEDNSKKTPLQLACIIGNEEITKLLIEKVTAESLYNPEKPFNESPIYLICSNSVEYYQTFKRMLEKLKDYNVIGLIQNKVDENNKTLLEVAIEKNHFKIVDAILAEYNEEQKQIADVNGNLIVHTASKYGNKELFELLIKHDAVSFKTNSKNENALHLAAFYNRFNFIKALLNYEKNLENKDKPMVKIRNNNRQTPLQIAIIKKNEKCVKELINSEHTELDVRELDDDFSIYDLCVIHSDIESMNAFLKRNEKKFNDPLFFKSKYKETPLHLACKTGQMEIVKLIMDKLYRLSIPSIEAFLRSQNKEGRTCFHLACIHGHYNIIEYFLNDLKINYFLEIPDNDLNTCLLLSAIHGNERIVEILLANGANINAKNKEKSNALEISCRKGYFEMAKIMLDHLGPDFDINITDSPKSLLHLATKRGAQDIVEILLKKGAHIDSLDENGENCLDVAIAFNYQDVIKVLLNDKNWIKLFKYNSIESDKQKKIFHFTDIFKCFKPRNSEKKKYIESKQFKGLADKAMWDMIEIILNNCHLNRQDMAQNKLNGVYDYRVLDPPSFKEIQNHPLMIIANSGEEELMQHSTIKSLLLLKWQKIPRFAFYSNILINLIFLILFTIYTFELVNIKSNSSIFDNQLTSDLYPYLVAIMAVILFSIFLQLILTGLFSFFLSIDTWIYIIALLLSFLSVTFNELQIRIDLSTFAILFVYLNFTFLIQKIRYVGIYVLAFKGTIKNSLTFAPVLILTYFSFIFSYRLRIGATNFYFGNATDSASKIFIKGLSLMVGNFQDDQMDTENSVINYILYFFFILILCILMLNLLVGIAVGEINQVLAKAVIQQISMRIVFVLQTQKAVQFLKGVSFTRKLLNMSYSFYDYQKNELGIVKSIDRLIIWFRKRLAQTHPKINLVDPFIKLDLKLDHLFNKLENENNKSKYTLLNRINYIDSKIEISQIRIEDRIKENARKALEIFENREEDEPSKIKEIFEDSVSMPTGKQITANEDASLNLSSFFVLKLEMLNESLKNSFKTLESNLIQQSVHLLHTLNSINQNTSIFKDQSLLIKQLEDEGFQAMKKSFQSLENKVFVFRAELDFVLKKLDKIELKLK